MKSEDQCYLLTSVDSDGTNIYSLRDNGKEPEVLIFQDRDDAERYAIMLEQDDGYIVGESLTMDIAEVELGAAIDILNEKKRNYILVKKEDLFIPPPID
ncbi:hypothetical protein CC030809_00150 [Synechococcus phage S-CAM7]|uniref:DUF3110 domain-containing protein n=2 Tax=Synechococcus phage S-CAM7 TaxID=1883368 RepID=A0A7D5KDM6_9CAUD|nr:hypothetical protein CC030809_00150 [Synechococcus phage S-CAM7]